MGAAENRLKARLAAGETQIGLWLNLAAASATEIAGGAGFDWCLIDGEHAPYDIATIQMQLRVLAGGGTEAMVRVPAGEDWVIKQVLDIGAQSLLVPMVDTPRQAERMVEAVRYAPAGRRGMGAAVARASGYGRAADYASFADQGICLMVQAETREAIANIDDIAAVEGVDGVFIGPADLSADMGYPGNPGAPEVQAAIAGAAARIRAAGKAAGIIHYDAGEFAGLKRMGFNFIAVGSDALILQSRLDRLAREAREILR